VKLNSLKIDSQSLSQSKNFGKSRAPIQHSSLDTKKKIAARNVLDGKRAQPSEKLLHKHFRLFNEIINQFMFCF